MRWVLLENSEVYVSTTLVSQRLKAVFPQRAEKGKKGGGKTVRGKYCIIALFLYFPRHLLMASIGDIFD